MLVMQECRGIKQLDGRMFIPVFALSDQEPI